MPFYCPLPKTPTQSERQDRGGVLLAELVLRHSVIFLVLQQTSPKLCRRFTDEFLQGDFSDSLPQICEKMALLYRFHADIAEYEKTENFHVAAAALDAIATVYPMHQRIQFQFRFSSVDNDAEFGPGVLKYLAWYFQKPFTDSNGHRNPLVDPAALDKIRSIVERPMPAEFFRLISLDSTMESVALALYAQACGVDPSKSIKKVLMNPSQPLDEETLFKNMHAALAFFDRDWEPSGINLIV